MQFFTAVLSALALAASTASANTIAARQNGGPRITSPAGNVTWDINTRQVVSWDTYTIPANETGASAVIFLGNDDKALEFTTTVLSEPFSLESGSQTFTVPSVKTSTHYYVVLSIGDSTDPNLISQPENMTPDLTILSSWA